MEGCQCGEATTSVRVLDRGQKNHNRAPMSHCAKRGHRPQTAHAPTDRRNGQRTDRKTGGCTFAEYVGKKNMLTFTFRCAILFYVHRTAAHTTPPHTQTADAATVQKINGQKGKKDHENQHEHQHEQDHTDHRQTDHTDRKKHIRHSKKNV